MSVFLLHGGLEALFYGIIIFVGLGVMLWKLTTLRIFSLGIDIAVFWLVFSLHGGSMMGGMAAAIAALLAGVFFPLMLRR